MEEEWKRWKSAKKFRAEEKKMGQESGEREETTREEYHAKKRIRLTENEDEVKWSGGDA